MTSVAAWQRFTKQNPCPICGGYESLPRGNGARCWGFLSEDGEWVHCVREEFAGDLGQHAKSGAYAHRLRGDCRCGASHDKRPQNGRAAAGAELPPQGRIVATYDYQDEDRRLLRQVVRFAPKDFRQRRPSGNGDRPWIWNVDGVRDVPYRLPELLEADPSETVYIVEGEKDVDRLRQNGLVATTNPMGAKKWREEHSEFLGGRRAAVIADNDHDGREQVQLVAQSLSGKALSVKAVELPGLPDHGDVSDWLDSGHTVAELRELVDAAPLWSPPEDTPEPTTGPAPISTNGVAPDGASSGEHLTDLGNARRLVALHGADLRYCHAWHKWLVWDGRRFSVDETAEVQRRAKDTVRTIYAEAGAASDDDTRKRIADHARRSESEARIASMIALSESEPGIPARPDDLDTDPWLLNVQNGTLDLRTGDLGAHDRANLITKLAPVDYDANAKAATFVAFIERILAGKPSLVSFIRRAVGYSLTGITWEEIMLMLYGGGDNGKTTFLELLREMLGDYAASTPPETFVGRRDGAIPNDIARLKGMRFVSAAEAEEGKRLSESLVKRMTGRDTISARFMRGEWFDFRPEFKPWLATNHRPTVRGQDKAIWDRIRLVPFAVTIGPDEQDNTLPAKLRAELPGVLAWAVEGCLEWQRDGLGASAEVVSATESYLAEQDTLGAFLDDACTQGEDRKVTAKALYAAYRQWCQESGEDPLTQRTFGLRLSGRGFTKGRDMRERWWVGIGLLAEPGLGDQ